MLQDKVSTKNDQVGHDFSSLKERPGWEGVIEVCKVTNGTDQMKTWTRGYCYTHKPWKAKKKLIYNFITFCGIALTNILPKEKITRQIEFCNKCIIYLAIVIKFTIITFKQYSI